MTITPLPTPPNRLDPESTFVSRANTFLGALPAFGTEANALAVAVNADKVATETAAALAPASLAAANFKGNWSALTGPLNVPSTVFHAGNFWTLASDLADVTAKTPGVDVEWLVLSLLTPADTATESEAIAGTVNNKVMTPLRTADVLALALPTVSYQQFTTSGTWTKPAGARVVYVEVIGGGGGGANHTGANNVGGGGGGGFNCGIFRASDFGATVAVTIGAGGNGGANGSNNNGGTGGNTTFGSSLTGKGGGQGAGAVTGGGQPPLAGGDGGGGERGGSSAYGEKGQGGYASGGGSYGGTSTNRPTGGDAVRGGAGGGGASSASGSVSGISQEAGNGGAGISGVAQSGDNGTAPGGGGGGSTNDGGGGNGAEGRARIWAW